MGRGRLRPTLPEAGNRFEGIIDLICRSWDENALNRPSFAKITCSLRKLREQLIEDVETWFLMYNPCSNFLILSNERIVPKITSTYYTLVLSFRWNIFQELWVLGELGSEPYVECYSWWFFTRTRGLLIHCLSVSPTTINRRSQKTSRLEDHTFSSIFT